MFGSRLLCRKIKIETNQLLDLGDTIIFRRGVFMNFKNGFWNKGL